MAQEYELGLVGELTQTVVVESEELKWVKIPEEMEHGREI